MNKCVLGRFCLLISILCFCVYYFLEFKGYDLKSWRVVTPTVVKQPQDVKLDQMSKAESVTCSSIVHRHKKVGRSLEFGIDSLCA